MLHCTNLPALLSQHHQFAINFAFSNFIHMAEQRRWAVTISQGRASEHLYDTWQFWHKHTLQIHH